MIKSILNFGKVLRKSEQKEIQGGFQNGPCVCRINLTHIVACDSTCPDGSDPFLAVA